MATHRYKSRYVHGGTNDLRGVQHNSSTVTIIIWLLLVFSILGILTTVAIVK